MENELFLGIRNVCLILLYKKKHKKTKKSWSYLNIKKMCLFNL